jgi:ubiquinone biosynthesis protein UbiJ
LTNTESILRKRREKYINEAKNIRIKGDSSLSQDRIALIQQEFASIHEELSRVMEKKKRLTNSNDISYE